MPSPLAEEHLRFAWALHRALALDPADTVCWSPFSVAAALGLAATGARGAARRELDEVLGDQAALLTGAATLTDAELAPATTLWVRPEDDRPGARIAPFAQPRRALDLINGDVARATRGLIPRLLDDVDPKTRAMLVTALYLKTAWHTEFAPPEPAPFHGPSGTRPVPTLAQVEPMRYAEVDGWQVAVVAAYGDVEAVFLLPPGELAEAEATLDGAALHRLTALQDYHQVDLRVPALTLRWRAGLRDALWAIGVRTPFETRELIDTVHEAVLRVDEHGIEGAAATALAVAGGIAPEPVPMHVDRPFLLLVRHTSGAVYFLARVTDPGEPGRT